MTRVTASEADAKAQRALDQIKAHEDLCAERYGNIHSSMREMRNWLIGTFVSVLMLALSLMGFFALRYFDVVTKPPVQSVQVQTTVK